MADYIVHSNWDAHRLNSGHRVLFGCKAAFFASRSATRRSVWMLEWLRKNGPRPEPEGVQSGPERPSTDASLLHYRKDDCRGKRYLRQAHYNDTQAKREIIFHPTKHTPSGNAASAVCAKTKSRHRGDEQRLTQMRHRGTTRKCSAKLLWPTLIHIKSCCWVAPQSGSCLRPTTGEKNCSVPRAARLGWPVCPRPTTTR